MKNEEIELTEIKNYHKNGKIREHYFVNENGKEHGISQKWYENGELSFECNFEHGKLHGVFKGYYENGKLLYEGNFENGERHGVFKWYHDNGELRREEHYENGELIG